MAVSAHSESGPPLQATLTAFRRKVVPAPGAGTDSRVSRSCTVGRTGENREAVRWRVRKAVPLRGHGDGALRTDAVCGFQSPSLEAAFQLLTNICVLDLLMK